MVSSTSPEPLVNVSIFHVLLSMIPLAMIALISSSMNLGLESSILIGLFRTLLQLSLLSFILQPIFILGDQHWYIVVAYIFLMVTITAHESTQRVSYHFPGMFGGILLSLLINVTAVSLFAFGIVVKPVPVPWEPQYVIPIAGMLLGNSINGVSLSLNSLLTSLIEDKSEIELMLSFGATSNEASARIIRKAVRTGATPILNSMAIIGLVSIPGMMTGQILAGSAVSEAAHYQMMIVYMIAVCTFGTILMETFVVLKAVFDLKLEIPRTDRLVKREKKRSMSSTIESLLGLCCKGKNLQEQPPSNISERELLNDHDLEIERYVQKPRGTIEIRSLFSNPGKPTRILNVSEISKSFHDSDMRSEEKFQRNNSNPLFQDISFTAGSGEIILISGPSGVGKSQLFRAIAGLTPLNSGFVSLDEKHFHATEGGMANWRRRVRYVTQNKVAIPGTPRDFMVRITNFHTWRIDNSSLSSIELPLTKEEMNASCLELIQKFGLGISSLDKEWTTLSGGEAQRMIVAMALASRPQVLLMDECTSALDMNSKLIVENTVEKHAENFGISVLWITHDKNQVDRMKKK